MLVLRWTRYGQDTDGGSGLEQLVVAIAVGGRLHGELEGFGDLQHRHTGHLSTAMQKVDDVGAADHLLLKRACAGVADGLEPVEGDHGEHFDELTIAVGVLGESLAQPRHRGRQVPVLEGRAIAQRPGLALERGDIVPRVV